MPGNRPMRPQFRRPNRRTGLRLRSILAAAIPRRGGIPTLRRFDGDHGAVDETKDADLLKTLGAAVKVCRKARLPLSLVLVEADRREPDNKAPRARLLDRGAGASVPCLRVSEQDLFASTPDTLVPCCCADRSAGRKTGRRAVAPHSHHRRRRGQTRNHRQFGGRHGAGSFAQFRAEFAGSLEPLLVRRPGCRQYDQKHRDLLIAPAFHALAGRIRALDCRPGYDIGCLVQVFRLR